MLKAQKLDVLALTLFYLQSQQRTMKRIIVLQELVATVSNSRNQLLSQSSNLLRVALQEKRLKAWGADRHLSNIFIAIIIINIQQLNSYEIHFQTRPNRFCCSSSSLDKKLACPTKRGRRKRFSRQAGEEKAEGNVAKGYHKDSE